MLQSLAAVTVLVPSYDEGLAFFRDVLGFAVLEDTPLSARRSAGLSSPRRWAPGAALVLAVPSEERQRIRIGDQTGGRVGFFLHSGDFWTDYDNLRRARPEISGNAAPRTLRARCGLRRSLGRQMGFAAAGQPELLKRHEGLAGEPWSARSCSGASDWRPCC